MPKYPPLSFEELNEADVREEVVAPILRDLGYRSGTEYNVRREQSLRYPRVFLGRKNASNDPHLRGKADYILEVRDLVAWVVESKAPNAPIGQDDVEQAWTYANHAEIRAVYFVLCNGRTLQVFQTQLGPKVDPILVVEYEKLEQDFGRLSNLLGPEALLRDFPRRLVDTSPPIGPGLKSVVRMTNGLIRYDWNSLGLNVLNELQITIAGGAIERDENGRLVAYLRTIVPLRSLQELNERLGLTSFEMTSPESTLSADSSRPTQFFFSNTVTLPAGEQILDIAHWRPMVLNANVRCQVDAVAEGRLVKHTFSGKFRSRTNYYEFGLVVVLEGSFDVHLA